MWFPWLIVVVQISAALLWSVVFNSIQLYVQKRVYEHTLGIYLSPKLVKKFSGDATLLQPGAEEKTITMLFSDIADFTSLSRNVESDTLAKFMNQYFHTAVSRCIHPTDGTVVKYIGDGIFAFWNAPDAQPDHALQACEAALLFREQGPHRLNGEPLRTRIGLHTGIARVGNFGSPERVDYTALGESVNLASRLEGLNKHLGTECLLSEDTNKAIGDRLVTRALGAFQLKGFDTPVEVFELLGRAGQLEPTRRLREAFAQALNNYRERNLEFAGAGFRRVLDLNPGDGPSKFYLSRLEELQRQPLPDNWSTNTIFREK
jgi:adenylate cyclase